MFATPTMSRTWLEELSGPQCAELLAISWMGRLAVMVGDHPEIFPVNHAFDPVAGEIAFPSRTGTKLHAAIAAPWVAFEVDGVDGDDGSGWSVLVIGRADELTERHEIEHMVRLRKAHWALSEQSRWLRIRPQRVTGRRISERPD
jgi:nitroimidazol reductase NimA-like FMN-containing flavoprotein (pyridoxamine 5'-phosphate oxidase superfamily)